MPKDIFYFSKPDRIATMILLVIIIVTTVLRYNMSGSKNRPEENLTVDSIDSVAWPESIVSSPSGDTVRRSPASRNNGTQYRNPSADVRKKSSTYGSSNPMEPSERKNTPMKYVRKKRPDTLVDLNSIDSVSLVKLPGIGPWFALRIVEYRDRLGGYCSVGQLAEIDGLQDSLMQWFVVTDTVPIRKVSVNRASLSELRRHPYINFYQARAIVELRRQYGPIKNPDRLSLLDEFTGQDLERLEPYLDFE